MQVRQTSNRGIIDLIIDNKSTNTNGIIDLYLAVGSNFGEWYLTEASDYIPSITVTNTLTFNMDEFSRVSEWFKSRLLDETPGLDDKLIIRLKTYDKASRIFSVTVEGRSTTNPFSETLIAVSNYDSSVITDPPELWNNIYAAFLPTDDLRNSSGTPTYIPLITSQVNGTTNNTTLYLVSESGSDNPDLVLRSSDHITFTNPPILQDNGGISTFVQISYILDYDRAYNNTISTTDLRTEIRRIKSNFVSM